jgi:hypothetical protein
VADEGKTFYLQHLLDVVEQSKMGRELALFY